MLLGPLSLFAPKGVKHDDRELFLLIEGPDWAQLVKCDVDAQARTRAFAQALNVAARNVHKAKQAREQHVATAERALVSAANDQSDIQTAEDALRGSAAARSAIYATATSLSAILLAHPEAEGRRVNNARAILADAHALLHEEVPLPPRPAPASAADQALRIADPPGKEKAVPARESVDTRPQTRDDHGVDADVFAQITQLGELRSRGLITTEEFETTKAALLARLRGNNRPEPEWR